MDWVGCSATSFAWTGRGAIRSPYGLAYRSVGYGASSASSHMLLIIRRIVLAFMHFIRHMMAFIYDFQI